MRTLSLLDYQKAKENKENPNCVVVDWAASVYGKPNYATNPMGNPTCDVDYSRDFGMGKKVNKQFANLVTKGYKVVKQFVIDTDFSVYRNTGDRDNDNSTNYEDKAFIYKSLLTYLGGYSQYALTEYDFACIGAQGNLNGFEVCNQRWGNKFACGATESFPEHRPQLILKRVEYANYVVKVLTTAIPELNNVAILPDNF